MNAERRHGTLWRRLVGSRNLRPCVALALLLLFNILFTKGFHRLEVRADPLASVAVHVDAMVPGTGEWKLEAVSPGSYDVMVAYRVAEEHAGREAAVAIGDKEFALQTRLARSEGDWVEQVVGRVRIERPCASYRVGFGTAGPRPSFPVHLHSVWLVRKWRLYGSLVDIVRRGSIVMLVAVGMTLVIATAGIDLSVGSVMAITGMVAAQVLSRGGPVWGAVLGGLAAALVAGLWNGALVAFLRLQPIVATLILLVAGRGIAQMLGSDQKVRFERPGFEFLGSGSWLYLPFTLFVVAFVVAATLLVTRKTATGLCIEAVGSNERASRLSGIRAGWVKLLVYGFSGLCAGVAGLIAAADIKEADPFRCGEYVELQAILAVVIGGTPFSGGRANVPGSILGALIMQTVRTMMLTLGVPKDHTLVVEAAVVVAVCLAQSEQARALVLRRAARKGAPG